MVGRFGLIRQVVSAMSHFGLVSVGVGRSSLGYGTEEYDRVEWNSM